jgi:hypothetical protein
MLTPRDCVHLLVSQSQKGERHAGLTEGKSGDTGPIRPQERG